MNKWCFPKIQQPITSVLFITRHKALLRVWHIKDAQQMFVPWKFTDWITRKPASSSGSSKLPDIWDREREKGGRRGEELKQDWHFGVWGNLSGSQGSLLRGRCSESGPFPMKHQHISNLNLKEMSLCSFDGNALTAFVDTQVQLQEPGFFAFQIGLNRGCSHSHWSESHSVMSDSVTPDCISPGSSDNGIL